jgi:hypothetical protein
VHKQHLGTRRPPRCFVSTVSEAVDLVGQYKNAGVQLLINTTIATTWRPMSLWRPRSCRILHEGGKMARVRVADDFKAIRLHLEE